MDCKPDTIGFYTIDRRIGKGNFAEVRLATHRLVRSEASRRNARARSLPNLRYIWGRGTPYSYVYVSLLVHVIRIVETNNDVLIIQSVSLTFVEELTY